MTRRNTIIKLLAACCAATTGKTQDRLILTNPNAKYGFQLQLDQFSGFTILNGKESINISPKEIWDALKSPEPECYALAGGTLADDIGICVAKLK